MRSTKPSHSCDRIVEKWLSAFSRPRVNTTSQRCSDSAHLVDKSRNLPDSLVDKNPFLPGTLMSSRHPSSFFPDLTDERLAKIAELLLDIRFNTLREMDSPYDDSYTREATVFGRSRNLLIEQCLSRRYSWLSLANPGMDVTFRIGSVPCRFFRDDPENPDKKGFFKRNAVDDLLAEDDSTPVMWRFVVERALTDEDEDRVFFIGYNVYQDKVSQWTYGASGPVLHSVDHETPASRELQPAEVDVRDDSIEKSDKAQSE